jgi:hypothetical protein
MSLPAAAGILLLLLRLDIDETVTHQVRSPQNLLYSVTRTGIEADKDRHLLQSREPGI